MIKLLRLCFACFLFALAGCASTKAPDISRSEVKKEAFLQKTLELDSTMRYQKRLDSISYPIMRGGHKFCGDDVSYGLGLRVAKANFFPEELQSIAKEKFDLRQHLKVLWVMEQSPADKAGIISGDEIIRINKVEFSKDEETVEKYNELLASLSQKDSPVNVTVLRDMKEISVSIKADKICSYPVVAVLDGTPNAFANGSMIAVNSGLLRLFENDRDVAVVVGHELAHNVKKHSVKGMVPAMLGAIVALALDVEEVAGMVTKPFSPPLEAEADYVGLYIVANSGVDIEGAENVWRKFSAEFAGSKEKSFTDSHPPTPERYVALKKTIQEINDKKRKSLPLIPNQ